MTDKLNKSPVSRRSVFAGVGAIGAVATAAAVLPKVAAPPQATAAALATAPEAPTGGYQLTEHVQRYYQTARV